MLVLKFIRESLLSFDYLMIAIIIGLGLFGITVIGSITNIHIDPTNLWYTRQQFTFVTGLFLFFTFSLIDYKFLLKFHWLVYVGMIVLLLAVWQFGDTTAANVTRGISIAGLPSIQPSQFSKIFMVIFLAKFLDTYAQQINKWYLLLALTGLITVPVFLVFIQPSLSASMVILLISITLIFLGGLSFWLILFTSAAVIPTLTFLIWDIGRGAGNHLLIDRLVSPFQIVRIAAFMEAEPHPQNQQSLLALGSGRLHGHGLNHGIINQLNTLPEAHNDFIFAVIGEEFGFVGANLVLLVLLILIVRCIFIAIGADSNAGRLLASGVAAILFYQTFIHVGVVTDILPNTGIALPFISYGGSSMWALMISLGIVMNVHISSVKSKSRHSLFSTNS